MLAYVSHDSFDSVDGSRFCCFILTEPNDNCRIPDILSDDDSIVLHKSDVSDYESPSESEVPPFVPVFGPLI